jgi:medium-chain acyl-[acyl-carrier-protein] hydrolase
LEIPDEVIDNDAVFNEMLPALRADILLGKKYKFVKDEPLQCPLTAFAGSEDTVFTEDQVRGWDKQTNSEFKFVTVTGGHLFCRDNKEELLEHVTAELTEAVPVLVK